MNSASALRLQFDSAGTACAAWHLPGRGDAFATGAGRPVVVMAHGLGGTADSGLAPFAEGFSAAGLDVFAFDYRGFGASEGAPRQTVSLAAQIADYEAAMTAATRLPGVDAAAIVLWGVSLSGGHVMVAGAGRDDVAAVLSLVPLVDGLAAGRLAMATHSPISILRTTVAGVASRAGRRWGRPVMIPITGQPGEVAALTLSGQHEDYQALAGPAWVNEIDAAIGLELVSRRPARAVSGLRCPLLVQIADFDRSAPPLAAARAAFRGRAQVRHYPCDHLDVLPGKDWFEPVLRHQLDFLTRTLRD